MKCGIIVEEDVNIYEYGCQLMVSEFISDTILLLVGLSLGLVAETIVFLVIFGSLRCVSGGYHAMSYRNGIIIFCTSSTLILLFTEWIVRRGTYHWLFIPLVIAVLILFVLAPVDSCNRRLEREEFEKYRRKTRWRITVFTLVSIVIYFRFPMMKDEMCYIFIAICSVAAWMIVGIFKNTYIKSYGNKRVA